MTRARDTSVILHILTWPIHRRLSRLIYPDGTQASDFLLPPGEPALTEAGSMSWQVFSNPLAVFVGGVAAVLLELAEPRVRSGVWEHTTFRQRPLERMRRTGYATMMTVFGARTRAVAMIERVNRGHERVTGQTPAGQPYRALDDDLLAWVHATASFGFLRAYDLCVHPTAPADRDRFYAEGQAAARLYGVRSPPASEREVDSLLDAMRPRLEASDIVFEFLAIMRRVPLLPWPFRWLQPALLRASIQCLPAWTRECLRLDGPRWQLAPWQWTLLRAAGKMADRWRLPMLPASLARRRMAGGG
jgi:uncharacterized protein (DUF2236 family)